MAGFRIEGNTSANVAEVDANGNLLVNLPTNPLKAGNVQHTFVRDATTARTARITEEGEAYTALGRLLFFSDFNGAAAGSLINTQWNQQATTQTIALTGGFVRLNNSAITTTNTGCAINTARTFSFEMGTAMRVKAHIRHTNASQANKVFEFGLGMYVVAANQAGATVEFVGYRWTTGGGLQGVLEYSTGGGSPTSLTVNINSNTPYSDNVVREYEVLLSENTVEFWINQVYQGQIALPADGAGTLKAASYPVLIRHYIGTATSLAPTFDIGTVSVIKVGVEADIPVSYRQALMGRHSMQGQAGLTTTTGNTAANVTSGTAPTATTGSNTAATVTGLGGYYAVNGAAWTAANINVIMSAYQNPAIPIAAGAASNVRNLVITDIFISPMIVTTVIAGGGVGVQWMIGVGNTAVSWATTDAAGTTTIGTKAVRLIPLGTMDVIGAAAAAGTVATRTGASSYALSTPIVVHPGEFISLGTRCVFFNAAITSGVLSGGIGFSGYWD